MTEPKIKPGMSFMDMKSAYAAMQKKATEIGGTVSKDGDSIVLKNKQGKIIANIFQYSVKNYMTNKEDTTYRYNDWDGREYVGKNTNGKFTEIFSGDGILVAHDKNSDGKVSENEIDLNI